MSNEIDYKNNPLHGLGLKNLLIEIVDHYGFEMLFAYLNINCFKTKPSIESSVKFLKKTDWAREKVEVFYLYEFKSLPRASSSQFSLPPRDRIIPEGQTAGAPKELSLEDAERLREKRAKKSAERGSHRAEPRSRSRSESHWKPRSESHSEPEQQSEPRWGSRSEPEPRSESPADSSSEKKINPWASGRNKSNR